MPAKIPPVPRQTPAPKPAVNAPSAKAPSKPVAPSKPKPAASDFRKSMEAARNSSRPARQDRPDASSRRAGAEAKPAADAKTDAPKAAAKPQAPAGGDPAKPGSPADPAAEALAQEPALEQAAADVAQAGMPGAPAPEVQPQGDPAAQQQEDPASAQPKPPRTTASSGKSRRKEPKDPTLDEERERQDILDLQTLPTLTVAADADPTPPEAEASDTPTPEPAAKREEAEPRPEAAVPGPALPPIPHDIAARTEELQAAGPTLPVQAQQPVGPHAEAAPGAEEGEGASAAEGSPSDARTDDAGPIDVQTFKEALEQMAPRGSEPPQKRPVHSDEAASAAVAPAPAHAHAAAKSAPAAVAAPPDGHFVEENHPKIVGGIRTQLLPSGGAMRIRLDPPELGALQVRIEMRDGAITASFETSNDDATRLLSHSLTQLKQTLESAGVAVEKLQVQQTPKEHFAGQQREGSQEQRQMQEQSGRQEQQRREALERLWRKLRDGSDPVDMMA